MDVLRPHIFTDADLAGCAVTQRSTTGVLSCVRGPHTSFPVGVICKRQGSVSHSTPEAEIVALDAGLRALGVPSQEIWRLFLPEPRLIAHEDNMVTIRIVESGRNQTMKHLGRTHGICIGWLSEQLARQTFEIVYEPSSTMAADVFTKAFSNPFAWAHALELVGLCPSADVEDMVGRGGIPPAGPAGGGKRGEWSFNADGSGSWTRVDTSASRYRPLRPSGPKREEVICRETWDVRTGEMVGQPMLNYGTATDLSAELPPPVPRHIRTVFYFRQTTAKVPPSLTPPMETAVPACSHRSP